MLAEERFSLILDLLARQRTATVQELCEALNASESTIRRDLNELGKQGKLNKVHGGATLPDSPFRTDEPTMAAKEELAVSQKQSIAQAAAKLILPEDFIYLDAGSSTLALARALSGPALNASYVTNGAGPSIPESAMQQLEAQLDTLQPDDILILAGSIPKSLSQSTYERLLAGLEGHGVRAVVDATQDLLVNVLPYHPFLIKPNNHELGEIVGRELKTDEEITAAARALQEKGARNVLVSMAGNGALLVDEHGEVHRIGCPKGKVVNSVGAGDSMVAGFVAGYLQSGSYEQALRLGTACGSATAFSLGLATKEKIEELFGQI